MNKVFKVLEDRDNPREMDPPEELPAGAQPATNQNEVDVASQPPFFHRG